MKIMKSIALAALALVAIVAQASAQTILDIPFDQTTTDLQKSGGAIEVQEDGAPALVLNKGENAQQFMFFFLNKELYAGKKVKFTVKAKGLDLAPGFLFQLQATKDGKMVWPGGIGAGESFDWKEFSFVADIGALGVEGATIRLGLQNSKGTVFFRNLKAVVVE